MNSASIPFVSVVLPIHNAGRYLRDSLDALVNQSLKEIEIIVVENGSTDDTLAIAHEYEINYPALVRVFSIPAAKTSAEGRSFGFKKARGKYIYSCDGDDLVVPQALELLYKKAKETNSDLVVGRSVSYISGKKVISPCYSEQITIKELCYRQNPSFWSRLIRRELIAKIGDIPPNIPLSDVAYIIPLTSYANSVSVVNWPPIYHYFRRTGSEVNTVFTSKQLDIVTPERIALARSNPKYREEVLYHIAIRIRNNIRYRWYLMDLIVPWLREIWPELEKNSYLNENVSLFKSLRGYVNLLPEPVPCVLYVNGFHGNHSSFLKFSSSEMPPFWNLDTIIELTEENCDIAENSCVKTAYDKGNYEFVSQYFALKNILKFGGIYLSQNISIDIPFNYVRYFGSFFGFLDEDHYLDDVFGGQKENDVLKKIMDTYSEPSFDSAEIALSERIRNVLLIEYDQKLTGKTTISSGKIYAIFGPEVLIVDPYEKSVFPPLHICRCQTGHLGDDKICISSSTLRTVVKNGSDLSLIKSNSNTCLQELNLIKASTTWKIVQKLRNIGDGPFGPFLKSVFRLFMRVYKKIK